MPLNALQRRDSWPPTVLRLHEDDLESSEDMDANPFAYFLTSPSPEEIDDNDIEDLTAGIESSSSPAPQVREVSPSSLQRIALEPEIEDDSLLSPNLGKGFAVPLSLRDFTSSHLSIDRDKAGRTQQKSGTPLKSAMRGRNAVRLTPSQNGRGRGQTRSLSARRPHSWREPSPDVWSIQEEPESWEDELPDLSQDEQTPDPDIEAPKKPKKKVRWALP